MAWIKALTLAFTLLLHFNNAGGALITLMSRLEDTRTNVGHLFNYTIPSDAFADQHTVTSYIVTDYSTGGSDLPPWLIFDQSLGRFTGLPISKEVGSYRYRIQAISAQGGGNRESAETEITIIVGSSVPAIRKISYIELQNGECPRNEKVRVFEVVLEMDVQNMKGQERIALIQVIAAKYLLLPNRIYLNNGDKGVSLVGQNYIEANRQVDSSISRGTVSWTIGCEKVMVGKKYGDKLRADFIDDSFSNAVGKSIIGYRFVLGVPKERVSSSSRSLITTVTYTVRATPSITASIPYTKTRTSYRLTPVPSQTIPSATSVTISTIFRTHATETTETIFATPTMSTSTLLVTSSALVSHRPEVNNPIGRITSRAGLVYRYPIPSNTFSDVEDGDTRRLSLSLIYANNSQVSQWSWLQLDKDTQELYGLPLPSDQGNYIFYLTARDSSNFIARDRIEYVVSNAAIMKNRIEARLEIDFSRFASDLKLRISVMKDFASKVGNTNLRMQLNEYKNDGIRITKVICSNYDLNLIACDRNAYEKFATEVNKIKLLFGIEIYNIETSSNCSSSSATSTRMTTSTTVVSTTQKTSSPNNPPTVADPIDRLNAYAGRFFEYKISDGVFFDPEDGNTTALSLALLTRNGIEVKSWIYLSGRKLRGLPLMDNVGISSFLLRVTDKGGLSAYNSFDVQVNPLPQSYRYIMSTILDLNYDDFIKNTDLRIGFVQEITKAFGERQTRDICIRMVTSGSVNISWTIVPLDNLPCNGNTYIRLVRILNSLPDRVAFKNEPYPLISSNIKLSAECAYLATATAPTVQPNQKNWIGTVLPATLSACLFILLILIIFFMYRNGKLFGDKRGKNEKSGIKASSGKAFLRKNRPVIMDAEVDDKPNIVCNPVMLIAEKPPQDPPMYTHTNHESAFDAASVNSNATKSKTFNHLDDIDHTSFDERKPANANFNSVLLMEDFNPDSPKPPQY